MQVHRDKQNFNIRQRWYKGQDDSIPGTDENNGKRINYKLKHCLDINACMDLKDFIAVVQSPSHVWLCNPIDCSTPGFPVLHCLSEFAQIHVHWVRRIWYLSMVMGREAWRAAIHGLAKSRTRLSNWTELNPVFVFKQLYWYIIDIS